MPIMFGFARQREELLRGELRRIAAELPALGAIRAYLVGNLVDGRVEPDSELELILVQATDEPFHRRADFWVTHLRPRFGTRFQVYTPREVEQLGASDPILRDARCLGEVILG